MQDRKYHALTAGVAQPVPSAGVRIALESEVAVLGRARFRRALPGLWLVASAAVAGLACGGSGEGDLTGELAFVELEGFAHGGDPEVEPATYGGAGEGWAEDGATVAYSHPATSGRVAGGVRAEAADTAAGDEPGEAEARADARLTSVLEVRRGGRFRFRLDVDLRDVELANEGTAWAAVRAAVRDGSGDPVPDGQITELVLELRPDGTVVADGVEADADVLDPVGAYRTTLTGPAGGVSLSAGRYLVDLELVLVATAPLRSGPNQVAAIGDGAATIRVR
jgi:hypothetical protein